MKKILSVLLSLVMILSLLPTTTMASDVITKVELNIRKPVAGEPWRWHKTATTVNKDSNYTVYQNAEWYDETEKRYMNNNEEFQVGHVYTVEIWTEANDGYEFDATATAYNLKATVNGKEAKVSKAFEYQRWAMAVVSYTFPEVKEHKEITVTEPEKEPEKPTEPEKPQTTEKPAETDTPTQTEKPKETPKTAFVDVAKGKYYYDAVMWAAENGITGGTSATTFSPEDSCTRGQVVTFLYRFINGQ